MTETANTTKPARHGSTTRLIDIVFPGDTNHHGTFFGGTGLALMDRVASIAATRFGRTPFVTASCEGIDFEQPATGHFSMVAVDKDHRPVSVRDNIAAGTASLEQGGV